LISDSVVHSAFDVSTAGTRIAYVRQQKDTTQHVIREAFGSVVRDSIDLYTVVPPLRVRNAPCIEQFEMSLRVLVNIVNDDNPSENMFFFLTSDKRVLNEHPVNALDVKIDPANDGIAKVAYILGDNGYESASQLYWTWLDRGVYAVKFVYDFAQHGVGAATFSWSPDGHYIAMFTGIFTAEPKLVIISDLSAFENGEIPLEKSIVLPQDENLYFASPDWAPSSDRVVLLVRNDDEEKNEVVIVNIETREMIVKVDGLSTDIIFNPTWKK
ncbi:MAG: hypothetical protein RAP03_09260, partial [Candidatus Electryonea clarkiae]|nr:hypothetical protein [Candidatus Electryonea clarkiae]